ncbi:uncharacterized protein LOC121878424 [Homarus americanus]|uniref:Uncharacterized protein n=1 Tax=Homarus americanus TaxID=6706 RepID=A0A8J5JP45_HOMAM|nr:uncharacterized protein LOC121878424 [Homarus americanus]XP_042240588.1 uncharacterized protein LOC121878424 [Homarus americanus]KAG7158594.1 hypothetical protein Hamer_G011241 [Homarus americanus]
MAFTFMLLVTMMGVSQCQDTVTHPGSHDLPSNFVMPTTSRSTSLAGATPSAPTRHKSSTGGRGPPKKNESSWSLSEEYIEQMLDIIADHERFPMHDGSQGDMSAVLTTDLYQGKRTLVYKLTPGSIFGGVRSIRNNHKTNNNKQRITNRDFNSYDNRQTAVYSNAYMSSPYGLRNGENNYNAITRPHHKWGIHYLRSPPPISSMDNPYLPPHGRHQEPKPLLEIPLKAVVESGSELVLNPVGKVVLATRSKARGAWVSFLLLHYLGFVPQVPGLPRHVDPVFVRPSSVNTPTR